MKKFTTRQLVLSGFFIVLGLLLPLVTGQIPSIGSMLLPMHIPVLLCGFICGGPAGLLVGFILPLFRSLLFGMPPMYPTALAMAFELAAYGFLAGWLYRALPKKIPFIYITLIISMIIGRIIWGGVSLVLFSLAGNAFTWTIFLAGAVVNAIPGIILQVVLVPLVIISLKKAKLMPNE